MTDDRNSKRHIFIRERVYKRDNHLEQIELEFIDDLQSISSIERSYSLWLTQDHYRKIIMKQHGENANHMPTFQEYIDMMRPLIAGHCCSEYELRRAFDIFDLNRNGIIELDEIYLLINIIGRSTRKEKISKLIECVNMFDDKSLNYQQFKQFARLGYGREMLINVSLRES